MDSFKSEPCSLPFVLNGFVLMSLRPVGKIISIALYWDFNGTMMIETNIYIYSKKYL